LVPAASTAAVELAAHAEVRSQDIDLVLGASWKEALGAKSTAANVSRDKAALVMSSCVL
jgi:hypothetical protein